MRRARKMQHWCCTVFGAPRRSITPANTTGSVRLITIHQGQKCNTLVKEPKALHGPGEPPGFSDARCVGIPTRSVAAGGDRVERPALAAVLALKIGPDEFPLAGGAGAVVVDDGELRVLHDRLDL